MKNDSIQIIKSSGHKARFSMEKLKKSLRKSGADEGLIQQIADKVRDDLYHGMPTKKIYKKAFSLLKKSKPAVASKYKLKKAIYELGPTGFPFERFIGALLYDSGYSVKIGQTMMGKCVSHEVDVVAIKNKVHIIAECKYHSEGRNCDVKIPLYIYSRYKDIVEYHRENMPEKLMPSEGWVVTNTRFTKDALQYGKCIGLYLLSWDYPKNNSLKDRIDRLSLYPITVSTLLTANEKQMLLLKDVVLCRQIVEDPSVLKSLRLSDVRRTKILEEMISLCNN